MAKAKDLLKKMDRTAQAASPIIQPAPVEAAEEAAVETPAATAAPVPAPTAAPARPAPRPPRPEIPTVPAAAPPRRRRDPSQLPRRLPSPPNPSRFSLDLDRDVHKRLRTFATIEAEVDQSAIGRVLVELLLEDPALRIRVRERIDTQKRLLVEG